MSLHDLLEDLAAGAPQIGAPPHELWQRGRRAARVRRLGTVAIVAAACLGLVVLGAVSWQARTTATPASTGGHAPAMPDRLYRPSGWLPSFDGAPGTLAAIMPTCQNTLLGTKPGLIGVSATTGRYGFLDLPRAYLAVADAVLAPDGHAVAYWTQGSPDDNAIRVVDNSSGGGPTIPAAMRCFGHLGPVGGFAVHDLRSGRTTFTNLASPHGIAPRMLAWAGDTVAYATYAHVDSRGGTGSATGATVHGVAHPSAAVMSELSDPDNVPAPAGHGRILVNETAYDKHASPLHSQTRHALVDLASGARTTFTQQTTAGRGTTANAMLGDETDPNGAVVSPSGNLSAYLEPRVIETRVSARSAAGVRLGVARLDGDVVSRLPSLLDVPIGSAVGWLDDAHVVITSPVDKAHPSAMLRIVTVGDSGATGVTTAVTGPPPLISPGQGVAYELLSRPTFHAQPPPSPLGQRKEFGIGAGVVVLAAAALLVWRRRARP